MRPGLFSSMTLVSSLISVLPSLTRAYSILSDATLKSLPDPYPDFNIYDSTKLLAPILVPRVPGTPSSLKVLQHFTDFWMHELPDWKIEYDNSTAITPLINGKEVPFRNFIASRDPPGSQPGDVGRLVLAAHYDSRSSPEGFIGATDSAVSCAILMFAAKTIDKALTSKWKHMQERIVDELEDSVGDKDAWNRGVMVVLLDGEEAFGNWTEQNSLYGARHLASTWEQTYHTSGSRRRTPLDSIDLFVLLDLLGSGYPKVPSYFKDTHWAYRHMADLEHRLRRLGLFYTGQQPEISIDNFLPEARKDRFGWSAGIQDDHVPFMQRGVDVLHLIPSPFPWVWHTMYDIGENLDMDTVNDWATLVAAFVAEWLELEGYIDTKHLQHSEL